MRGKRTDFSDARCPIARTIGLVGDQWSLLIVRDALRGTRRFNEFRTSLGLAKNILADRLRKLVEAGVLEAQPSAEGSSRNDYLLTEKGRSLSVIQVALAQWGECYAFAPDEDRPQVVDRRDGRPVRVVALAEDGRTLGPGETMLKPLSSPTPATPPAATRAGHEARGISRVRRLARSV